jgi:HEPN domain-containing protein
MKPPELWGVLLDKARQDEYVLERLVGLADSPDEVLGFHLQQAAEKLLKAALARLGVAYRRTHNLTELMVLLEDAGCPLPDDLAELQDLTPYATDWRYDLLPGEGSEALERDLMLGLVRRLRDWVESLVAARNGELDQG